MASVRSDAPTWIPRSEAAPAGLAGPAIRPAKGMARGADSASRSAAEMAPKGRRASARKAPVSLALSGALIAGLIVPGASAKDGDDADAQVRQALRCESRGQLAERVKHLALAVLIDPGHPTARGLLGLVAYRGRWQRPDDASAAVRDDAGLSAALAEYAARRQKAANTADAQWRLARWCEQKGLTSEMTAHLVAATRLDPGHERAWTRLGYMRHDGRWMTREQVAADRAEAEVRRKADRRWKPLLITWRGWLSNPARREDAERRLGEVTDPLAVPSIRAVFAAGGAADQARAVQLLGQVDAPAATPTLAALAVFSPSSAVRRAACETLSRRDRRAAEGLLVGLLRDPKPHPQTVFFRFRWLPAGALAIGSPGFTFVEGRGANLLRFYTVDENPLMDPLDIPRVPMSNYEGRLATQRSIQMTELESIVGQLTVETLREVLPVIASTQMANSRVIQALRNISGEDRGDDWEAWTRRWVEEFGYAYDPDQFRNPPDSTFFEPKPTFTSQFHTSCFGAGTPVRTLAGPRPIESARVGDLVLTQHTATGALAFAPVLGVAHNRPAPTLRIALDGEEVVATGIHRFWKPGRGWVMARDLKPGDAVRTLEGLARVSAVSEAGVRPVYNLEVGEARSFFVGRAGALVHDNSPVLPVPRPFDAVPDAEATDAR